MKKRVFLIVLDSFGIGGAPDAADFGDAGSDTLAACAATGLLEVPNMIALGLGNVKGVQCLPRTNQPLGAYARLRELSRGKDTTIGHWEIAGVISPTPLPTYPDGFPEELLDAFRRATGRGVLCNKPISGTEAIRLYGDEHLATGDLIVYTSADSVFQIAAHEDMRNCTRSAGSPAPCWWESTRWAESSPAPLSPGKRAMNEPPGGTIFPWRRPRGRCWTR